MTGAGNIHPYPTIVGWGFLLGNDKYQTIFYERKIFCLKYNISRRKTNNGKSNFYKMEQRSTECRRKF